MKQQKKNIIKWMLKADQFAFSNTYKINQNKNKYYVDQVILPNVHNALIINT